MASINIDSVLLTEQDRLDVAEASRRLARGEDIQPLPHSVVRILSEVLNNIASGAVTSKKNKISTTEAADYLNVSRPYVYRLLNEGKLAYHMVGTHRRIYLKDVQAYKAHQDEVSYAAMQELQEQAQELNMGY